MSTIESAVLELMAIGLTPPLQFAEHLHRAFEAGFRTGQKPVTAEIVAITLAPDFDGLEPRLTCQGYSPKVLADQFHTKPDARRFSRPWFHSQLCEPKTAMSSSRYT